MARPAFEVDVRSGPTRYDPYSFGWDFSEPAPGGSPESGMKKDDFQLSYICPSQFSVTGKGARFQNWSRMIGIFKSAAERTAAKEFLIANTTPRKFFRAQDDEARRISERTFERFGFKTRCDSNW